MHSSNEEQLATGNLQEASPASSCACGVEAGSRELSPAGVAAAGGELPPTNNSLRNEVRVWTRDLLIAIGLALVIIVFLYQPVKVEGTSMAPLLSDQERIFINKFVYRFASIERGDVVVFWYPLDRSKSFIKRVIGLPGDTLEMRQGTLYVNGKMVPEPYVPLRYEDFSNFGPVTVPKDSYFVMGDHRISSNDSRVFGAVENKFIYGRAVFAYWPVDHFGSLAITDAQSK
ncbi:MAG: signal peptidase I [Candidatus Acidiferrum sp.]|jgi:signal peptidase I